MTKEEIALKETMGIFNEYELGITGLSNAMDVYAEQQAIAFGEWLQDKSYTKSEKGWYRYYQKRVDFPAGFSMSTPVYEFHTIKEIYEEFLKSQL